MLTAECCKQIPQISILQSTAQTIKNQARENVLVEGYVLWKFYWVEQ